MSTAVTWTIDRDLDVAYADHDGVCLAVIGTGRGWAWRLYLAFDDGGDDEIIARGTSATLETAMAEAAAALAGGTAPSRPDAPWRRGWGGMEGRFPWHGARDASRSSLPDWPPSPAPR